MRKDVLFGAVFCILSAIAGAKSSVAQTVILGHNVSETVQVPSRVVKAVDSARLMRLGGNTNPLAQPRFDRGLLDPSTRMDRMMLVLDRSPEQEQELQALGARQSDPNSADFHHWLHADEFGRRFGPSDADMSLIQNWLQSAGFTVNEVAKGRTWIQFSGTVSQVQSAFHVEMHNYVVNGEHHIANDRDPQIPEALAPVVAGIASLHNFFPKPQIVRGKLVKRDRATGKVTVLGTESQVASGLHADGPLKNNDAESQASATGAAPQLTYADASGDTHEDLTPYDFATIYNYLPLWNNSKTGTGVSVAIAAGSDIDVSDLNNYRKTFGLPATTLNVIHNGTDPGQSGSNGDQAENTLDVEMVSASAPGATIDLVVSANTNTTGGFQLSDAYIVDNEVASIMSASYGECELQLGTANNAAFNKIWQQGASEGISIFESSGDQGSSGCTRTDGLTPPQADQIGLQVNGMASSPYVTAVGGTDFTWSFTGQPISTYWNSSNNADYATAKGYLPEVPWNSTCSNPLLLNLFSGESTTEQLCNDALNSSNFQGLVNVIAGSGGYSHCTTPSGTTGSTCSGGYAKPSWQTGQGVPADGKRDVPDVSLFASGGFPDSLNASAILFCESSNSPETTCDYTNPDYIIYQEIGGTSASSPLLAGIMALVVQKTGSAQGLANPEFYKLFANQVAAGTNCDSSTDTNASTCVFHDISSGTISQVCITGDPDCVTNTSGDEVGLLSGYATTKGYDEAIGLGSVNVNNLVNNWVSTAGTAAITLTPTSATFPSTTVNMTSPTTETFTAKNTGSAAVTFTNIEISGTNYTSYSGSTTCSTSTALAVGSSCTITISFTPSTTGTLTATLDVVDNAGTQTAGLSGTGEAAAGTASVSPTSIAFPSTKVGTTSAYVQATLTNNGTAALTGVAFSITGTNASSFFLPSAHQNCTATLAAGASCTFDAAFEPTTSGALTASVQIKSSSSNSPQTVALSGTGTSAAGTASVSPTSIAFPSTKVGTSSAYVQATLTNNGTAALTGVAFSITGTNASSFFLPSTHQNCTATLAAGASCTFDAAFEPTTTGALTASVKITDSASNSPQTVALSGTGTSAAGTASVSPTSIAFPSTKVGTSSAYVQATLTNNGTAALTGVAFSITGTNASSFFLPSTHQNCTATLAAGASCTFDAAFEPTTTGALTASVKITDSASNSPQTVALTGTGTGTGAATASLSPTSIAFPSTKPGTVSSYVPVTFTNNGSSTLTGIAFSITGTNASSFFLPSAHQGCGTTLAAGASCTFDAAFEPTTSGALSGSVKITDSATNSPQTVALSGTGTGSGTATATLSPTSIVFGNTKVGSTSSYVPVTFTNNGSSTLTGISFGITGANASSFFLPSTHQTCGSTLAAGASCTFDAAFKPTATGALTGTVFITDSATNSPQTVALSGTGQ